MTASEVANVLDAGITINIGVEEESNRIHELFYSECDQECFVAIVDRVNHVVVTILPTDYHENISWKVSLDAQLKARALTAGDRTDDVFDVTKAAASLPSRTEASTFKVNAYFRDASGNTKATNLGSWPGAPYELSVERLIDDDAFFNALEQRLTSKGIQISTCEAVFVRRSHNDTPTRISLKWLECPPTARQAVERI